MQASNTARPNGGVAKRPGPVGWILVAVAGLYAAVLLFGPLLGMVWGSLSQGAARLVHSVFSPDGFAALELSVTLSSAATVINTLFGVPLAIVMVRHRFRGRGIINALIEAPLAVPPVVAGLMIVLLFGRGGLFDPILRRGNIHVVFAWPSMLMATVFVSLPFVAREIIPVLQEGGTEQQLAAHSLGAGRLRTFFLITLPSIRWGLLYGIALTFARSMGEFGAVMVVSGGIIGLTETTTLFIFRSLDDRNYAGAYAMSLILALLSFAVMAMMEIFKRRALGQHIVESRLNSFQEKRS
jgi:sulfate/thiosulfate transport system permease protein